MLGMATSSSAAAELGRSSGIESSTVASSFAQRENQIRIVRSELSALTASLAAQTLSCRDNGPRSTSVDLQGFRVLSN